MAIDDSYTKLLLHCDGADASTTITDEAGHTMTANGNAQLDTAQKKFGTASLLLDGTTDYVTTPDSDDWYFGNGDFTIDFWFRPAATPTNYDTWVQQFNLVPGHQATLFKFDYGNGGKYRFIAVDGPNDTTQADYSLTSAAALSADTWYHLALVRSGTNIYIFKDGISQALDVNTAISTNTLINGTGTLNIGYDEQNAGRDINGHIDELRISKGIARWTTNFTPPTVEYTSNTLLQNLVSYYKLDETGSANAADSVGSNTLTNSGITYATGKINNGAFNNSNTDSLSCTDNGSLSITGAHTVSYWINFNTKSIGIGQYMTLFGKQVTVYGYNQKLANNGSPDTFALYYTLSKTSNGSEQSYLNYQWASNSANTWYHIVWTYTPSTSIKLYINGTNVASNTTSIISSIYDNSDDFRLNSISTDSGTRTMDEFGIWNRVLTDAEITTLYNSGNGIQYPFAASGPANLKTWNGIPIANIKTINGVPIASLKSWNGIV